MGQKPFREEEMNPNSAFTNGPTRPRLSTESSYGVNRSGSTKKHLGRSTNRLSMKVTQLAQRLHSNLGTKAQHNQRHRPNYASSMVSTNPIFNASPKTKAAHTQIRQISSVGQETLGSPKFRRSPSRNIRSNSASVTLVEHDLSDGTVKPKLFKPKPPASRKNVAILPPIEEITSPFEECKDPLDYRSFQFATLQMTEQQLRDAAVEMLLCSINIHVIKYQKLNVPKDLQDYIDGSISPNTKLKRVNTSRTHNKEQNRKTNISSSGKDKSRQSRTASLFGRLQKSRTLTFSSAMGSKKNGMFRTSASPVNADDPEEQKFAIFSKYEEYFLKPSELISDGVREAVREFVDCVAERYTKTSYHSFRHAVDVTQMMFMLGYYLKTSLSQTDPFVLLASCLCHDIGHFGANNHFLMKEKSLKMDDDSETNYFIQKFGYDSPLEHYHLSVMKSVVDSCSLFSSEFMSTRMRNHFDSMSKEVILSTDMDKHDFYVDVINREIEKQRQPLSRDLLAQTRRISHNMSIDNLIFPADDDSRPPTEQKMPMAFLFLAMKVCDVANVSRPFQEARHWAVLLTKEFEAMGTINNEKYPMGMQVTEKNRDLGMKTDFEGKDFKIADNLTSRCLIEYQPDVHEAVFPDWCIITTDFMADKTFPMARMLSAVESKAGAFFQKQMFDNFQRWGVMVNAAKGKQPTGLNE